MPIDYANYPPNWKTEIRPRILQRADNCCEKCKVSNGNLILRGVWHKRAAYQDVDGWIYDAATSERIGGDYLGEVDRAGKSRFTKVVLTIAHLDHDTTNNADENLMALCQRCHLNHDKHLHMANARATRVRKSGQLQLL